jgi:hypothetical protein
MYVVFPSSDGAFASIGTDFLTTVGSTGWSDWQVLAPLDDRGTQAGDATALGVEGIIAGQFSFPPTGGRPVASNPIAFWRATYTAPADIATSFDIQLSSMTEDVFVYLDPAGGVTESRIDGLEEGAGMISVIGPPCPADFDGDGELTVFDFLAFQNAFADGDLKADFDGDGALTLFDFLAFQNAFDAGCR